MVVFFDIGHPLVRGSEPSARRRLASRLHLSEKETKRAGRLMMVHPATNPDMLAKALKEILAGHSLAQISSVVEDLWEEQSNGVTAVAEATPVLKTLNEMGIRLGIASNIWHPFYLGFRRVFAEILDLLDFMILSYQLGWKKPSWQFYQHAVSQAGIAENECWMVGDTYHHDIAPALRQGMRTIWLLKHPEKERMTILELFRGRRPRPDWVADNLDEIVPFLQDRKDRTC